MGLDVSGARSGQGSIGRLVAQVTGETTSTGNRSTTPGGNPTVSSQQPVDSFSSGAPNAPQNVTLEQMRSGSVLLVPGSTGEAVSTMQEALGVPQTGTFDQETERAVRSWKAIRNFGSPQGAHPATVGRGTMDDILRIQPGDIPRTGRLSAQYESNGDPGTVSTGAGDSGGVSYGNYQMATNMGTPQRFVDFLRNTGNTDIHSRLQGKTPGSTAFSNAWRELARDPALKDRFAQLQHDFIAQDYYVKTLDRFNEDPALRSLDIGNRSQAVKDMLWSTSVQHGNSGAATVFTRALAGRDPATISDADLINAVYDERSRKNSNGTLVYFSRNSQSVQNGVYQRLHTNERRDALRMLQEEQRQSPQTGA